MMDTRGNRSIGRLRVLCLYCCNFPFSHHQAHRTVTDHVGFEGNSSSFCFEGREYFPWQVIGSPLSGLICYIEWTKKSGGQKTLQTGTSVNSTTSVSLAQQRIQVECNQVRQTRVFTWSCVRRMTRITTRALHCIARVMSHLIDSCLTSHSIYCHFTPYLHKYFPLLYFGPLSFTRD